VGLVLAVVCPLSANEDDRLFYVKVTKANTLEGQVVEISELKVTTGFGEVSIPMEKVEAVKMHADADDAAIIAFVNGDMITGKIDLSELQLKTTWGTAHINIPSVEEFSTSQFGRFYADPTAGGWRYSRGSAPENPNVFGNTQPLNNSGFPNR
jgi:hypothetical protein